MASSTGHTAPVSKDIYWRRRAFVLIGLLLVLALIAYACSPSEGDNASDGNQASVEDPSASPSVPAEEPSEEPSEEPEEDPSPSPSADPSAGEDDEGDEGSEGEGEGSSDGGSADAAAPERDEDPCRPQDVVVSFDFSESDRELYGGGAEPGFKVSVVNVAEQTCTVDVGPEAVELIIHSGDDRIFSTSDCVEGEAEQERQLEQGRPHDYTITWERDRSFTDCRSGSSQARAGWYKANLRGDIVSGVDQLVFQLKA
ncbi:hypothetical protein [Nocardiopsis sp. MG754419]|uniref:hypothetical protein n=1 Tax=Nocardiopsis sp. MG754419 TaxID=2259865 RepID=UPI001BAE01AC|nr:hypothetical protein [Nocardiopsis sp. MG754419]MBR8742038.1 hypothetical protein [Nocardiopsis sp. MG754419]